ncbi:MAG: hypothetical protein B7C24_10060 [Bacteroidetes bacterium 4572_77]|nr:MAG: hypothetical protein B7C24_10060 [Bacteroidetes bacterium 4572_77]
MAINKISGINSSPDSSESIKGIVELSTDAEAKTGTSDAVVMTPGNVRAAISGATTVTSAYTSLITDSVIYGNSSSAFTITLLAAATAGANKRYTIANINSGLLTVDGNGSEMVGGLGKQCIGQNEAITIDCDGSNWHIVHDARVKSSTNLLTNSGFGVWSNSEGLYTTAGTVPSLDDATELATNGSITGSATGWTLEGTWAYNANTVVGTDVPIDNQIFQTVTGLTIGKLYEVSVECTAYTDGSFQAIKTGSGNAFGSTLSETGISTVVFEATATFQNIGARSRTAATNLTIDSISLHEVTPGIVSATTAGPDGWGKNPSVSIFREMYANGGNIKEGSQYGLKIVQASLNNYCTYTISGSDLENFRGKTVTCGSWVNADFATPLILMWDGVAGSESNTHGGGGHEWLEVTQTIATNATSLQIRFDVATAGETAFYSQPMLVFGSSIGEGNYVQPSGEWVNCESAFNIISDSAPGAADDKVLNLEAVSEGKIPKGVKVIDVQTYLKNTSISAVQGIILKTESTDSYKGLVIWPEVNNIHIAPHGTIICDPNGDIYQNVTAAGDTLEGFAVYINRIQVSP